MNTNVIENWDWLFKPAPSEEQQRARFGEVFGKPRKSETEQRARFGELCGSRLSGGFRRARE
jgi:hypothetical protein